MPDAIAEAAAVSAVEIRPAVLLRRQRKLPPALPDWSDPDGVRAWIFRPVPVRIPPIGQPRWSTDRQTITRVYEWMLVNGWGGGPDAT